jgi:hypothetical protein
MPRSHTATAMQIGPTSILAYETTGLVIGLIIVIPR